MRMWGIEPAAMCRRHLLGEHVELHMLAGCVLKGKSLEGFYSAGLIDARLAVTRHAELVEEMEARGYLHLSPLPDVEWPERGHVSPSSRVELMNRCAECRAMMLSRRPKGE